jgi:HlyD family secretion protein
MSFPSLSILLALGITLAGCSDSDTGMIEGSGTIEGTEINIGSEVAGKVARMNVEEGDTVRQGDTLASIDPTDYRLQLRQAEAGAAGAEAQYRLAMEGARREDILQAEALYRNAEADYLRAQDLLSSNTVTRKYYDDAYTRYVTTKQTYEKLAGGLRSDEVAAARAGRDQARAHVEFLAEKLNDCTIISPSDGVVTLKAVEAGEFVTVGGNVAQVTRLTPAKLVIYVNETDLGLLRLGQPAEITIDTFEDRVFPGTVTYISPVAEFTPKNVQTKDERAKLVFGVRLLVDNAEGILKPGMPADARIPVDSRDR